jgi:hypothetical protein
MRFTRTKAQDLCKTWDAAKNHELRSKTEFLDIALEFIKSCEAFDAEAPSDNWVETLDSLGVDEWLKKAILMPEFEDIRSTASAKFWVSDAITGNYWVLVSEQRAKSLGDKPKALERTE